jgi:Tfp pilus assembly protein PilX
MTEHIKRFKFINNNTTGFVIPTLLMVIVVFSIFMVTVGTIMGVTLGDAARNQSKQTAFNIAEAGVNYYLWHISHDKTDFKDGNSTPILQTQYWDMGHMCTIIEMVRVM